MLGEIDCALGLLFPGPFRGVARGRAWGGFLQVSAFTPPCGKVVVGAGVRPAEGDGKIDFKAWLSTLPAETLPKYYALLGFGIIAVTSHNLPVNQEAGRLPMIAWSNRRFAGSRRPWGRAYIASTSFYRRP